MKKLTAVVAPVLAMSMALTACSTSGGDKRQAQILALAEIANQKKN